MRKRTSYKKQINGIRHQTKAVDPCALMLRAFFAVLRVGGLTVASVVLCVLTLCTLTLSVSCGSFGPLRRVRVFRACVTVFAARVTVTARALGAYQTFGTEADQILATAFFECLAYKTRVFGLLILQQRALELLFARIGRDVDVF